MDQDAAENRIADLERQLGEARAATGASAGQGSAMPPPPVSFPGQVNAGQQGGFPGPPQAGFPPPPVDWQHPSRHPPSALQIGQMGGPGSGRLAGPRYLLRRVGAALVEIGAVVLLLVFFGTAAYNFYAYQAGTPTTATIEKYNHGCVGAHSGVIGTLVDTNPLFDFLSVDTCTGTWSVGGTSQSGPIVGVRSIQPHGSSLDVRVLGGKAYTATSEMHSLLWATGIAIPGIAIALIVWWRRRTGRSTGGWLRGIFEFVGDFFGDD
jgi:hypothetical protein